MLKRNNTIGSVVLAPCSIMSVRGGVRRYRRYEDPYLVGQVASETTAPRWAKQAGADDPE